jgi:hypothetical protein
MEGGCIDSVDGSGAKGSERHRHKYMQVPPKVRLFRAGSLTDCCPQGQANHWTWALEAIRKCVDSDGNIQKALQESGDD